MGKREFKTELDYEIIDWLLTLPTDQRKKELHQCNMNSLARAMAQKYALADAKKMVNGMDKTMEAEFIKAVRIYKGDLPTPTKTRKKIMQTRPRYWPPVLASLILLLLIVFLDRLMP
ncbi:hypothetical protein AVO42_00975 [Thiomicrospira sp. XS5]|uniref:hypothetical protein n=1 Tax=Thiomicrospira sp. XS5 TaxID=1775636 RepID=UPI0007498EAB|nr:hypothetical protein [Thiomicrospira sp. XS5]KUJ74019.1 hypothetical protein AVO42_00975 [Thiomicrospira sp. XS5]